MLHSKNKRLQPRRNVARLVLPLPASHQQRCLGAVCPLPVVTALLRQALLVINTPVAGHISNLYIRQQLRSMF